MKFAHALCLIAILMSAAILPMSGYQNAGVNQWRRSKDTDFRGNVYNQFELTGKFIKTPGSDSIDTPSLLVRCRQARSGQESGGKFSSASLRVGIPLKIDYVEPEVIHGIGYYPKVRVRYRLDEGKERQEEWDSGAEKNSSSMSKDSLKRLLGARTVLMTVQDSSEADVTMQFDFPDSAEMESACRLGHPKK